MGTFAQFAAVNTKIKVLKRDFLTTNDYLHMLEARSVEDVVRFLKEDTRYGALLVDFDPANAPIGKLEVLFRVHTLKRYEKMVHYLRDQYRVLFKVIFMRYEVENLKLILRAVTRKESLEPLVEGFYRSSVIPHLDYQQLVMAKSIEEAIHYLQDTPYYKVLFPYIGESPNRLLFYMEMSLDRMYFRRLDNVIRKLDAKDKGRVEEFLGKNSDILNIQWIYRGLKFYHISPEELFNYSLTSGHALDLKKLRELCYSADEKDLVEKLRKTRYAFLFAEDTDFEPFMEIGMERYLYSLLKTMEKNSFDTVLPTIIYIHRLEYEMRDLFSLMEAKKFGLGAEETKQFLVRSMAV